MNFTNSLPAGAVESVAGGQPKDNRNFLGFLQDTELHAVLQRAKSEDSVTKRPGTAPSRLWTIRTKAEESRRLASAEILVERGKCYAGIDSRTDTEGYWIIGLELQSAERPITETSADRTRAQ